MLRNYRERRKTAITSLEKNEQIVLAYYLYELSKEETSPRILRGPFIEIFSKLVDSLKLNSRLEKVLKVYKDTAIKKKYLIRLENVSEGMEFDQLQMSFEYKVDRNIDRLLDMDSKCTVAIIDLCRVIMAYEKTNKSIFSEIISNVMFSTDEEKLNIKGFKPGKEILDTVNDLGSVKFLMEQTGLNDNEARYILFRYRRSEIEGLNDLFNYKDDNSREIYLNLLNFKKNELELILRPDQKLKTFGFIDEENAISSTIIDCIVHKSIDVMFTDLVKPVDSNKSFDLDTFSVPAESSEIMKQLVAGKSNVSILLYGKPGAGKTEYAKALCKAAGKNAILFKNESSLDKKKNILGTLCCYLNVGAKDSVLIVDEAEDVLRTQATGLFGIKSPTKEKGAVNKMLEESNKTVIYIVNHINEMEESTKRRFTFSCRFDSMPANIVRDIAASKLKGLKVSKEFKEKVIDLLGVYHITGASIDNVIKTIKSLKTKDEEKLLKETKIVLRENSALLNGKAKMRETVSKAYDFSVLNTSIKAEKIVRMVENARKFAERNVLDTNEIVPDNSIRMLFYGLSGTGKTEFARYLAEKLNKKILLVRASDILGKYVGESEENIRRAFEEAESTGQILLFDEADSFFADRKGAQNSWERTQVNEFLTQMEEFNGIMICTTNLRQIMDTAMLRRFHITVDFTALDNEGIEKLLKKYFSFLDFSKWQVNRLADTGSVTPGDFSRLAATVRFMDEEVIDSDYIIDELCKIQKEKLESDGAKSDRKIGFSA